MRHAAIGGDETGIPDLSVEAIRPGETATEEDSEICHAAALAHVEEGGKGIEAGQSHMKKALLLSGSCGQPPRLEFVRFILNQTNSSFLCFRLSFRENRFPLFPDKL